MTICVCVHMETNWGYLKDAAVCPTWIYEINHLCKYGYYFGLSSTCSRMSYMNLRDRPYVYLWILIWFIFNMLPNVLHESTKLTICVFMDTNWVYHLHAAVCPTWIYEIDHMCMYGYYFGLSSTYCRISYMNLWNWPYMYVWILIWFIFNMLPYVLHESTKSTICVCMDTNLVYILIFN